MGCVHACVRVQYLLAEMDCTGWGVGWGYLLAEMDCTGCGVGWGYLLAEMDCTGCGVGGGGVCACKCTGKVCMCGLAYDVL